MSGNNRIETKIDAARELLRADTLPFALASATASRRRFLSGLLAGAGSLALAACGGGGGGSTAGGGTGTINSAVNPNANASGTVTGNTTASGSTGAASTAGTSTAASSGTANSSGSSGASGTASTPAASLFYGMNGHVAYTSGVYATVTPAEQLALLQDLGVTNYRADIYSQIDAQSLANTLTGPFANSGVSILPCMIPVSYNQAGTESDAYSLGYQLGVSVATPLKGLVQYIECGNELDASGLISNGAGNAPEDYNPAYWPAFRGVIRGMIDGVKSVDATIKCGVNVGVALAYTALQMLWNGVTPDGSTTGVAGASPVQWDVTMYHWYQSSGDILRAGENANINVLAILAQSFGVPIWLTEWGFVPGNSEADQASYVSGTLNEYYSVREQYNLQSVMMYELISSASTDDFGLIETDGITKTEAYTAFKAFTAANAV
jgi:hypothetical protein